MSLTIAEIMERMPAALIAERAEGVQAVVHFKFTGDEAGEWNAVISGAKCTVAQGIPKSRPTLSLTADSSDFLRLVSGEMDGARAVMDGTLKVTGDTLLAPKLIRLFRLR